MTTTTSDEIASILHVMTRAFDRINKEFRRQERPDGDDAPDNTLEFFRTRTYHHDFGRLFRLEEAYHQNPRSDPGLSVAGFYDGTAIHVDDNTPLEYAEVIAHAIDGPDREISGTPEWQDAWEEEKDNIPEVSPYHRESPDEWFARLTATLLSGSEEEWNKIVTTCPISAGIIALEVLP